MSNPDIVNHHGLRRYCETTSILDDKCHCMGCTSRSAIYHSQNSIRRYRVLLCGCRPRLRCCYTSCDFVFCTTSYGGICRIEKFLTGAYELFECDRAYEVVNLHGLGLSIPSELMDSMLSLLDRHTSCFMLFLHQQQLLDYVRPPHPPLPSLA